MYYTVTVGYESEQLDREGNPRITRSEERRVGKD